MKSLFAICHNAGCEPGMPYEGAKEMPPVDNADSCELLMELLT